MSRIPGGNPYQTPAPRNVRRQAARPQTPGVKESSKQAGPNCCQRFFGKCLPEHWQYVSKGDLPRRGVTAPGSVGELNRGVQAKVERALSRAQAREGISSDRERQLSGVAKILHFPDSKESGFVVTQEEGASAGNENADVLVEADGLPEGDYFSPGVTPIKRTRTGEHIIEVAGDTLTIGESKEKDGPSVDPSEKPARKKKLTRRRRAKLKPSINAQNPQEG